MVLGRSSKKVAKKVKASSSSQHVHHVYSSMTPSGLNTTQCEILSPIGLQKRQVQDRQAYNIQMNAMPSAEQAELEAICSGDLEEYEDINQQDNIIRIDDILSGDAFIDISHAGGELTALADDLFGPSSQ